MTTLQIIMIRLNTSGTTRLIASSMLAALLAVVIAGVASRAGAQQPVSFANADFEQGSIGVVPPGWQTSPGMGLLYTTDGAGLSVIDPENAYSGSQFATATWQATGAGQSPFSTGQEMSVYQDVDLSSHAALVDTGSNALNLSFAYNDADPNDVGHVRLEFFDDDSEPIGFTSLFTSLGSQSEEQGWSSRTLSGQMPVGARAARITLAAEAVGSGSARNISFDALSAEIGPHIAPPASDVVHGSLIQFNQNGAWSWYQDERAIVDRERGELIVGSTPNFAGLGGQGVDGQIQTVHVNLSDRSRTLHVHNDIESYGASDDHNVPALLKKEDGDILAFYTGHNNRFGVEDDRSSFRTYDTANESWGAEREFDWWDAIPDDAPGSGGTTYSNLFQLADEDPDGDGNGRLYNIARTQQSPHLMVSDDNGQNWRYGGQLTEQPNDKPASGNYVNGYYKYVSNGTDRIDFIATEYHPRDFNTSIYHAYISGGKIYDSEGNEVDADIFSAASSFDPSTVPSTDDFTQVFQADGEEHSRAWNTDVQSYSDGTVTALFKTRAVPYTANQGVGNHDHRVWFARLDPATNEWTTTEIAQAGANLYGTSESDYTGLGALDPSDPNTIYISTEVHPTTEVKTDHHEIYKGVTADDGATWSWTAVTENSTYDNLRPIIPSWERGRTALLWWKGTMSSSQNYDTAVVGLILDDHEAVGPVTYVDANGANTRLASGGALDFTTGNSSGPTDDAWHYRTLTGNGGGVFTADELANENAPMIKTTSEGVDAGAYDVFAYFWVEESTDWRVSAGLTPDNLAVYRIRGAQHASVDEFDGTVVVDEGNRSLYKAYLGRVELSDGESVVAYIDDYSAFGSGRVWYDGLGYAPVTQILPGDFNDDGIVDAADFTVWRDNLGSLIALPNEDPSVTPGAVTQEDFDTWLDNYGAVSEAYAQAASAPEPAAGWLLAGAWLCTAAGRWSVCPARARAE
ncbi:hypothetical protein Mal64_30280 [Pseudobythopirellula maris]|uniref:Uncharacterized protein n=1 Tax=Pseudobythopirellula maris TaxID=2527991 RepID=A0A5C5ZJF5_9BACT|nr:BNR-4 repeat-containing protein [Pseudobythopirellula maris]TWT87489.1 hypothetical protein Mal64_30280 [Pseudobythopirellula maris]